MRLRSIYSDIIFGEPKVYVDEAFKLVLPNEMRDILAYPNIGCYPMDGIIANT